MEGSLLQPQNPILGTNAHVLPTKGRASPAGTLAASGLVLGSGLGVRGLGLGAHYIIGRRVSQSSRLWLFAGDASGVHGLGCGFGNWVLGLAFRGSVSGVKWDR